LHTLVSDTASLHLVSKEVKEDSLGKNFQFNFSGNLDGETVYHTVKLNSGRIYYYSFSLQPESGSRSSSHSGELFSTIFSGTHGVIILFFVVMIIIYLILFSRKEAVSLRIAIPITIFVSVLQVLRTGMELWGSVFWIVLLGIVGGTIFMAGGILFLYAVADAIAREQWSSKLAVTDLFHQGKFFTFASGWAVLRGIGLGIISLASYVMILFIYLDFFEGTMKADRQLSYSFTLILPVAVFLLKYINLSVFNEYFFRLFAISVLKKWIKKNGWVIIVGALVGLFFSVELEASNPVVLIFSLLIPALLFAWFFVRYEILTTLIGYFTFMMLSRSVVFVDTGNSFLRQTGYGLYFILIVLILMGVSAIILKRKETDNKDRFIPDYIRRREEKERLIRELDIARSVQQQFLPKKIPLLSNYEIAAICQPAWEVGGDYYDYFHFNKNRIGFAIGDVSNKGISAAFFMTLVKGILKALSREQIEPAEILCETNRLFYDDVERGNFISMIYGILDTESGIFTFSRAGHNPLLLLVGQSDDGRWLTPPGVGIGLLPDKQFRSAIRQENIEIKVGDCIVLYTDGYSEAMNPNLEEYGEDRLKQLIERNRNHTPAEIIRELESDILKWQGKQPAHDDRTIVVIKRVGS